MITNLDLSQIVTDHKQIKGYESTFPHINNLNIVFLKACVSVLVSALGEDGSERSHVAQQVLQVVIGSGLSLAL